MTSYSLYLASDLTRRFEPALDIDAPSDRVAIDIAEDLRSCRPAELWNGSRMVREWKDKPSATE